MESFPGPILKKNHMWNLILWADFGEDDLFLFSK